MQSRRNLASKHAAGITQAASSPPPAVTSGCICLYMSLPQGLEHDPSDELSSGGPHAAAAAPHLLSVLGSLPLGDAPETPSLALPGASVNVQRLLVGGKARFRWGLGLGVSTIIYGQSRVVAGASSGCFVQVAVRPRFELWQCLQNRG
jgi:hypothetical protein